MPLIIDKQQLSAAVESTVGTAVSTSSAASFILEGPATFTPTTEMYERNGRSATLSNYRSVPGGRFGEIAFDMALYGNDGGGTPAAPDMEIFLQGCGLLKAGSTPAWTYTASSVEANHKSLTIGFTIDGIQQRLYGARGNVVFRATAGGPIIGSFRFMGVLEDQSDTALLTEQTKDTNAHIPPIFAGVGFSMGGLSSTEAILNNFELDLGNVVVMRRNANNATAFQSAQITHRRPVLRFGCEYLTAAGGFNFDSVLKAGTVGAWTFTAGSGNSTVKMDAPVTQMQSVERADVEGIYYANVVAQLFRSSATGDDEFVLTLGA